MNISESGGKRYQHDQSVDEPGGAGPRLHRSPCQQDTPSRPAGAHTELKNIVAIDPDSTSWLDELAKTGIVQKAALTRLHLLLLRAAMYEAYQRGPVVRINGPELDDIALQATNDAVIALLSKLGTFRGESRFTTWAYRFVVLEVTNKISRHFWRRPSIALEVEDWDRLPGDRTADPLSQAIQRELISAVQRAVKETLTDHQRRVFVAIAVHGIPLDTVASESGSNRNAIYKTVFDARRKIRAFLTTNGYLER